MKKTPVTVAAPPSKSLSHRKLIAASLAGGVSRLSHVLESDDTARTIAVLQSAGAVIERTAPGEYAVSGMDGPPRGGRATPVSCDMGESGTSCRLLAAVLAAGNGSFALHGAPRLHERPMAGLLDTLASLGAGIRHQGKTGFLPLVCEARGLSQKGDSWLPVRADHSSQFLSGLLMAAPLAENGLRLRLAGERVASWPYVGLTLQTMEESGRPVSVTVFRNGEWIARPWRELGVDDENLRPEAVRFSIGRGPYLPLRGHAAVVEGDYSGASYLLAAGAIGPNPVTVAGLRRDSLQGDRVILDILTAMGASVSWRDGAVTVSPGPLRGITRDMRHCPDLVPTVAVLACLAKGRTVLEGVAHLRVKESDRLQACAAELSKTGCRVSLSENAMAVDPPDALPKEPLHFAAHNDHRMAMSLALFELLHTAVTLDDPRCVGKSFPSFWRVWRMIHPGSYITEDI